MRAAALEWRRRELAVGARRRRVELGERRHQRLVLPVQLGGVLAVIRCDAQQHVLERRQSVARLLGEIGAAEERPLVVVSEKHGERPAAAALRQQLLRDLVDAVDVGPLFAVDLDVDEVVVEDPRGGLVLETLSFEDTTPMAGVVAYAQVNGFLVEARLFQCFGAPRIPLYGVVRVLPQVRTGL